MSSGAGNIPANALDFSSGNFPIMSDLAARIEKRLRETGSNATAAAVAAGLGKDYIRDVMRGQKRSISNEAAIALSRVLLCRVEWLVAGTGPELADESGGLDPADQDGVRFGGIVEAGAFRPVNIYSQDDDWRTIPIPHNPHYPLQAQFAFQVMGDSMTRADIREGMYVLAVEIHAWEQLHGWPGDGKLVVVARSRNGDPERELTVKCLRIYRDRMELQPMSDNPAWKPIAFRPAADGEDTETEARIIAVVLSATRLF